LVSAEQFTIGGAESVRGYLESQALGDYGIFGSLELRTPPLLKYITNKKITNEIKAAYAFSFIDAGQVNTLKPLPDQDDRTDLLSVGVGLRLKLTKGYFTNLDYSHVLREAGEIEKDDERLLFRVGYEW
jgi:hemolysin activation/secretion protein